MPETGPAPRLYVGSHVTYHGRHAEMHDRPLYVLPCTWEGRCEACNEWDLSNEAAAREHFMVVGLSTDSCVKHADRASLTLLPCDWPEDAVPFNINGYWYAAAYTTRDGISDRARKVHFYTAEDFIGAHVVPLRRTDTGSAPPGRTGPQPPCLLTGSRPPCTTPTIPPRRTPMSDKPTATPDGYCMNKQPVSGTLRTINASATGRKFSHLHGRRMAQCPCGKETSQPDRGNLRRHKQTQE